MNIIYASDAALPGTAANSVHVMKMCQAFADNGNRVKLIARKSRQYQTGVDKLYELYNVRPVFDIHMSKYPEIKGKGIVYSLDSLFYILRNKPDIVYGRSMYICGLTSILLHRPVIFEIHGETQRNSKFGKVFSMMLKSGHLKRLVVISNSLSEYYQKEWDVPQSLILVAHDGADLYQPLEDDCEKVDNGNRYYNVGYFGSLFKGKGMELIVKLAKEMPEYQFNIFGGTSEHIATWKKETVKINNIIYHGFISQKSVGRYAKAMDVLIAPYQPKVFTAIDGGTEDIAKYMSPLKLFEYMSFKKPIVCTDLPVIREIIKDREDAVLCKADDIESWIKAINEVCSDQNYATLLEENAFKKLKNKYTWKIRAKKVVESLK